jgi:hypothetical protein
MALRVVASEVRQILKCTEADVDNPTMDAFITAASAVVDKAFTGDTTTGVVLLKEIEKYFTAHIVSSTIRRMGKEEEIQDARIVYTGVWKEGLSSTPYGQMVLSLDPSGRMAKTGKGTVSIKAITSFDE